MNWILRINGLLESLSGLILLLRPDVLLMSATPDIQGIAIGRLYGILAFFFGILSLLLQSAFVYTLLYKRILLAVIAFHFCVGLYMHGLYSQHIVPNAGAAFLHLGIAIAFLLLFMRDRAKFEEI